MVVLVLTMVMVSGILSVWKGYVELITWVHSKTWLSLLVIIIYYSFCLLKTMWMSQTYDVIDYYYPFMLLIEHCVMMSSYVTVVYVNC
jgi:hypothetical protein